MQVQLKCHAISTAACKHSMHITTNVSGVTVNVICVKATVSLAR